MNDSRRRILIIDDEPSIVDNIVFALTKDGYEAEGRHFGGEALEALHGNDFALVVLDIGLPDMSGFDVCREIRKANDVPIIFLTARSDEIDRILGLELGADDYVVKPFSPRELVARVRAILRRTAGAGSRARTGLTIDEDRKLVAYAGERIDLTPNEYGIVAVLTTRPGNVYSREILLARVWLDDLDANDRIIDTHVKSIRRKLRETAGDREIIRTHRGFGYSIDPDEFGQ